jgi:hypothetical protein
MPYHKHPSISEYRQTGLVYGENGAVRENLFCLVLWVQFVLVSVWGDHRNGRVCVCVCVLQQQRYQSILAPVCAVLVTCLTLLSTRQFDWKPPETYKIGCDRVLKYVHLHFCTVWHAVLTLTEEYRLRVFENRVLRRIFRPKRLRRWWEDNINMDLREVGWGHRLDRSASG